MVCGKKTMINPPAPLQNFLVKRQVENILSSCVCCSIKGSGNNGHLADNPWSFPPPRTYPVVMDMLSHPSVYES
ncbi:hypothetical protein TNCV_2264431 [Trichonephila clavipes]|nr:hypothetical protein TNCV_2264431 [Trichonephila clavipes]